MSPRAYKVIVSEGHKNANLSSLGYSSAPANEGIKLIVSAGLTGGSMEVIILGGFGKLTLGTKLMGEMLFTTGAI